MSTNYAVWDGPFLILSTTSKQEAVNKYKQYEREGRTVHVYETTYKRILPAETGCAGCDNP